MTISEGHRAPDFDLIEDAGEQTPQRLSDLLGRPVVLYFYPRDDTPGCTTEAKDFSCLIDAFAAAGTAVIGISPDSTRSHGKFREKHELKVRLVADETKAVAETYGVWVEKQMYGRSFMGVERATFLIDAAGMVQRIWRNVRVPGHAEDVLEAVRGLSRPRH
jgi:peroxiredoxin Q/BCP